ncbi:hypothetical protein JXA63_00930 [Candidatus Woesebacteria bacterium]|nr:hypothetical protein [Candidatus Woesebacteria bacterium]
MIVKRSIDNLELKFSLIEKILTFHTDFHIHIKNIKSIKEGKLSPWRRFLGFRCPGTFLPGVFKLGTYYTKEGREFWFWLRNKKYEYTIELKDEKYERLIISTNKKLSLNLKQKKRQLEYILNS